MTALPFVLERSDDVVSGTAVTSTRERVDGLLIVAGEQLLVQWRLARKTDHVGAASIHTDRELEPVREVAIPLAALAGMTVHPAEWWRPWRAPRVLLTASDLRAFEEVAGATGLKLDHPAAMNLPLERSHRLAALEFAAELNLILAEREQVRQATSPRLPHRETRELPDGQP